MFGMFLKLRILFSRLIGLKMTSNLAKRYGANFSKQINFEKVCESLHKSLMLEDGRVLDLQLRSTAPPLTKLARSSSLNTTRSRKFGRTSSKPLTKAHGLSEQRLLRRVKQKKRNRIESDFVGE